MRETNLLSITIVVMLITVTIVWWGMDQSFEMGRFVGQIESCRGSVPKTVETRK